MPDKVLAIVLAGGEGKRLMPLTADRAKPAVPFGGIYRLIDFVLSNLVNGGLPEDRGADPVQEPQPRPARHQRPGGCRRCSATTSRRCRRSSGSGPRWFAGSADAIYQSLNLIGDEQPDARDRVRRRPHLPDGPEPDGAPAHRVRRGRHGGRHPPADRARRPVRRDRDRRRPAADRRVPGEADRRRRPGRRPDQGLRLDGQLRLHHRRRCSTRCARTPSTRRASTTWAATSSRCSSSAARLRSTTSSDNDVPGSTERDRGYWRDVGTLDSFYDAHMRPDRRPPDLQPLQQRVADLHRARPAAAGEVRAQLGGPDRARRRLVRVQRRRGLRRHRRALGPLADGCVVHSWAEVDRQRS